MQLRNIGTAKCIVFATNPTVGRAIVLPAHYVPAPLLEVHTALWSHCRNKYVCSDCLKWLCDKYGFQRSISRLFQKLHRRLSQSASDWWEVY